MTRRLLALVVPSLFLASSAQAVFIAGWDFGEYFGPGAATIDGVNLATQLDSQYSDFDPTFGAGQESRQYGTMFADGTNGSDLTNGGDILPTSDAITLLQTLPQNGVPAGDVPFDSVNVLGDEDPNRAGAGQLPYQDVSLIANQAFKVSFMADLGPGFADSFSIDFAAVSLASGGTIDVAWSDDGTTFNALGTANVGTTEAAFNFDAQGTALDGQGQAWFQLMFNDPSTVIDNLGISGVNATNVPEPGTALLLVAGLVGLARVGRARA